MIMFFNFDRYESFNEILVPHFCGISSKQRQNVENTEVSIFNLVRALCSICISKTGHEKSQKLFVVFWEKPPELILYLIKSCKKIAHRVSGTCKLQLCILIGQKTWSSTFAYEFSTDFPYLVGYTLIKLKRAAASTLTKKKACGQVRKLICP